MVINEKRAFCSFLETATDTELAGKRQKVVELSSNSKMSFEEENFSRWMLEQIDDEITCRWLLNQLENGE